MRGARAGLITNKDRVALYKESLPRGAIIECDTGRRLKDTFREMSRKAVSVAVVDDAALEHPEEGELDILDWAALPQKNPMRIIFAASPERSPKDPIFAALAEAKVYDIVRPESPEELFREVRYRIDNPASADCAERYLGRGGKRRRSAKRVARTKNPSRLQADANSHPLREEAYIVENTEEDEPCTEPSWSAIMPDTPQQRATRAKRRKTISTASLFGHPGATTLAMSLAIWLARETRKKTVCALSDNAFFNHLKAGFTTECREGSFVYKGVTFCTFAEAERITEDAACSVYDCGRLYTTHADTPASSAHRRFYTSDLKLMCLEGQPWDMPKVKDALKGMAPSEIASWKWCVRSSSSDFISQLKAFLESTNANTENWYRTPENPDFFARAGHDGFNEINYDGLLGRKRRQNLEGGSL